MHIICSCYQPPYRESDAIMVSARPSPGLQNSVMQMPPLPSWSNRGQMLATVFLSSRTLLISSLSRKVLISALTISLCSRLSLSSSSKYRNHASLSRLMSLQNQIHVISEDDHAASVDGEQWMQHKSRK